MLKSMNLAMKELSHDVIHYPSRILPSPIFYGCFIKTASIAWYLVSWFGCRALYKYDCRVQEGGLNVAIICQMRQRRERKKEHSMGRWFLDKV